MRLPKSSDLSQTISIRFSSARWEQLPINMQNQIDKHNWSWHYIRRCFQKYTAATQGQKTIKPWISMLLFRCIYLLNLLKRKIPPTFKWAGFFIHFESNGMSSSRKTCMLLSFGLITYQNNYWITYIFLRKWLHSEEVLQICRFYAIIHTRGELYEII